MTCQGSFAPEKSAERAGRNWRRIQALLGCVASLGAMVGAVCLLTADSAAPACELSTYDVSYTGVTTCGGSFSGTVAYHVTPKSWSSQVTLTSGNLPLASPAGWSRAPA